MNRMIGWAYLFSFIQPNNTDYFIKGGVFDQDKQEVVFIIPTSDHDEPASAADATNSAATAAEFWDDADSYV